MSISLLCLVVVGIGFIRSEYDSLLRILPRPKKHSITRIEDYTYCKCLSIYSNIDKVSIGITYHLKNLIEDFKPTTTGIECFLRISTTESSEEKLLPKFSNCATVKHFNKNIQPPTNGYVINSENGEISIVGVNINNVLHGLVSLRQVLSSRRGRILNMLNIEDYPSFQHRGVMLDTSRHFIPIRTIKQVIQSMSYAKLNILHWHIIDDQSFPICMTDNDCSSAYSILESYSLSDLKNIVNYANEFGIEVIPEMDSPAHSHSWMKAFGNELFLSDSVECTSKPSSPDITNEYVYKVIEDKIFKPFNSIFTSEYYHIGADELDEKCYASSPKVGKFFKNTKGSSIGKIAYRYFINRVKEIAKKYKKTLIAWDEFFESGGDPQVCNQLWRPWQYAPMNFINSKCLIVAPDGPWYLDAEHTNWWDAATYDPCAGIPIDKCHEIVRGGEGTMWAERIDGSNLLVSIWPRMSVIANILWSYQKEDFIQHSHQPESLVGLLTWFRCWLLSNGFPSAPLFYNEHERDARSSPTGPGSCGADWTHEDGFWVRPIKSEIIKHFLNEETVVSVKKSTSLMEHIYTGIHQEYY